LAEVRSYNLHPGANAIASFYICKNINPEKKIGTEEKTDFGVRIED
jgi:hypothetical protein